MRRGMLTLLLAGQRAQDRRKAAERRALIDATWDRVEQASKAYAISLAAEVAKP